MITIHKQFIALQKAAHERAEGLVKNPLPGDVLLASHYEVLSDAIAGLPLDALAGEPALGNTHPFGVLDKHDETLRIPPIFRLSQVGGHCVYCHAIIQEALRCPGCGHVDPPTVGS